MKKNYWEIINLMKIVDNENNTWNRYNLGFKIIEEKIAFSSMRINIKSTFTKCCKMILKIISIF